MPEEENPTPVAQSDLALRAAVAYRVKKRVGLICDPVIKANAQHMTDEAGSKSRTAELPLPTGDVMQLGSFTRTMAKAKFEVVDEKKVLDYADEQGETQYVIRPSFLKALLSRVTLNPKTGEIIDTATGEIVEGIAYVPGGLTDTVTPSWNNDGVDALDCLLGFVDAALENLPHLTAANFALPELEAGQ
ncbi:hypothetical protein [Streptomyces microflavus]|uniref:hypothetical protein n=1 Tax=Streptomyces microflavus TaxID=1919 RepID=UPI0033D66AAE